MQVKQPHPVYTGAAQHFKVMPCLVYRCRVGRSYFPNPQSLQGLLCLTEACTPVNTKPELLHLHKLLLEAGTCGTVLRTWSLCVLEVEVMWLNDTG